MGQLKPKLTDRHNAWENGQTRSSGSSKRENREVVRSGSMRVDDLKRRERAPSRQSSLSSVGGANGMQIWYPDQAAIAQEQRRREEGMRRTEQRTQAEQAGIARRQQEADEQARAARRDARTPRPAPLPVSFSNPQNSQSSQASSRSPYDINFVDPLPILPLESPTYFGSDSTDADKDGGDLENRMAKMSLQQQQQAPFGV